MALICTKKLKKPNKPKIKISAFYNKLRDEDTFEVYEIAIRKSKTQISHFRQKE